MKILYLGSISTSDSDFPLINELEHQGQDVRYYVPISKQMCCAGTIEIKKVKNNYVQLLKKILVQKIC